MRRGGFIAHWGMSDPNVHSYGLEAGLARLESEVAVPSSWKDVRPVLTPPLLRSYCRINLLSRQTADRSSTLQTKSKPCHREWLVRFSFSETMRIFCILSCWFRALNCEERLHSSFYRAQATRLSPTRYDIAIQMQHNQVCVYQGWVVGWRIMVNVITVSSYREASAGVTREFLVGRTLTLDSISTQVRNS